MESKQLIFRKRTDLGKIYLFLPKTGKILESKSINACELYKLLELMKFTSVTELDELNNYNKKGLLKGIAKEALDIYQDLKELKVSFANDISNNSFKDYIIKNKLLIVEKR